MDWIQDLLFNSNSIAHAVMLYAFVIALGVVLGKIKIFGVSLGVTFVLFVGIIMGHFQFSVNGDVLHFIREFGLILFIYSIGLQVGAGFFSSFKKGGMQMNMLAVGIVVLNIAVMLAIYFIVGDEKIYNMVGVLSGAVTNTPGLGAAQQTWLQVHPGEYAGSEAMSMGYAAAYPLGVVGIIASMLIVKACFKIKLEEETKQLELEAEESTLAPHIVTFQVTNPLINGRSLMDLSSLLERNFVVSRVRHNDEVIIPDSGTTVQIGDYVLVVLSAQDEDALKAFIGPEIEMDWESIPGPVLSRRIVITKSEYNGRSIGSLRLRMGYRLNATRVNRAGVDLLATPNLHLQMGDRITVVGRLEDIDRLAAHLGNSMKRLNEPNMITLFVGIFLGIIVGCIPMTFPGMSVPMKLGLAGGPLVVAILISRFGYKIKLVTYTSSSASLMLREIGICLFLASVGIAAGKNFFGTVFNSEGAMWVLYGFLITVIPLIIIGLIARGKFKMNYYSILGLMSGSCTDPPALAYGNKVANNDAPAVAYSTVYPLTMFLRVISAQILILALS